MASSRAIAASSPSTIFASFVAVDFAAAVAPGNALSISRHSFAFIKRMHDGVGIMNRHASLGEELSPSAICPCRASRSGKE